MLRRLIRGYYSLRYFPRRLFAVLHQLSVQMTALEQGRARALQQGSATLADIEAGIGAFCDDATRAMLGLDRSIAAASARMSQVHGLLMRADAATHQSGGMLNEVKRTIDEVRAQTSSIRVSLNDLVSAPSEPAAAVARSLETMVGLLTSVDGAHGFEDMSDAAMRQRYIAYEGVKAAVSIGIAGDVGWDLGMAGRGIPVWQFDPTISAPFVTNSLFTFERIAIVDADASSGITLETLMQTRLAQAPGPVVLKLDMDLVDFGVISTSDDSVLTRFQSIVLQFRNLDRLEDEAFSTQVRSALGRLARTHLILDARASGHVELSEPRGLMMLSSAEIHLWSKTELRVVDYARTSTTKPVTYAQSEGQRGDAAHVQNAVQRHEAAPAA